MSQLGVTLIKDATESIMVALREDRFSKDEMEFILRFFKQIVSITEKKLTEGERREKCPNCFGKGTSLRTDPFTGQVVEVFCTPCNGNGEIPAHVNREMP